MVYALSPLIPPHRHICLKFYPEGLFMFLLVSYKLYVFWIKYPFTVGRCSLWKYVPTYAFLMKIFDFQDSFLISRLWKLVKVLSGIYLLEIFINNLRNFKRNFFCRKRLYICSENFMKLALCLRSSYLFKSWAASWQSEVRSCQELDGKKIVRSAFLWYGTSNKIWENKIQRLLQSI